MPESVTCNLCGSDERELLFELRDYRLRVDDMIWSAVRCRQCGLGYLSPRPTKSEIFRYYPRRYFDHRSSLLERFRRQATYVRGSRGRLLDIGAASGEFLLVMRDRGWEVLGIEASDEADNRHNLPILRGHFPEDCDLPPKSFDVITAWAVFEHLHDPAAAFQLCAHLLSPGGRLIIQVPNLRSVQSRWALREDVPRHLYFFTPNTLSAYGKGAGLELRRVVHTTDLFGGSGRGVLRLFLVRALGKSVDDFFEIARTPGRERFRRWPVLATACTVVAAIERVLLADWVTRLARVSGQIVVEFEKSATTSDVPQLPAAA